MRFRVSASGTGRPSLREPQKRANRKQYVAYLCHECLISLSKNQMPSLALANRLFRGSLSAELESFDITWAEEMACASHLVPNDDPPFPRALHHSANYSHISPHCDTQHPTLSPRAPAPFSCALQRVGARVRSRCSLVLQRESCLAGRAVKSTSTGSKPRKRKGAHASPANSVSEPGRRPPPRPASRLGTNGTTKDCLRVRSKCGFDLHPRFQIKRSLLSRYLG